MSLPIGVKDSFSESELSLHETIRKLTSERDSALHLVAGLEVQVLELGQSKEDAITAIFERGIANLREEFSNGLKDQKKEFEEFKRLVAPLFAERQIRMEKKEAKDKEGLIMNIRITGIFFSKIGQECREKLRQGTLAQVKAFCEFHEAELGSLPFLKSFAAGTIPFPMEEPV